MTKKEKQSAYWKQWYKQNRAKNPKYRAAEMEYRQSLKLEVLTHYGLEGKLQCCWKGCKESDIDVLTLDHIDNSGKEARKAGFGKTSQRLYRYLRICKYPEGFQTLCMNHQLKKEIIRKRELVLKRLQDDEDF